MKTVTQRLIASFEARLARVESTLRNGTSSRAIYAAAQKRRAAIQHELALLRSAA